MTATAWAPPGWQGEAGVTRRDITPPVGIRAKNWGAARTDLSTGAHRPLTLTALALRSGTGSDPVVLISIDLCVWRRTQDEWLIRGSVLEALGLDETRVLVHLTHTHAGPSACSSEVSEPGGQFIPAYLNQLRDAAVDAAREAVSGCAPAVINVVTGRSAVATCRDLPLGERYVVGYNPTATADDTVLIGRVRTADDRPLATIVNYACHPTTLAWDNTLVSPDYVGALREIVEDGTDGAPCLFLQGASGELAPREQYSGKLALADRHGYAIGHAVLGALATLPDGSHGLAPDDVVESGAPVLPWLPRAVEWPTTIRTDKTELRIEPKPAPTFEELERRWAHIDPFARAERISRATDQRSNFAAATPIAHPVWTWQVGELIIVGHPGEAYSPFQRELRHELPDAGVFALNLTNGFSVGYLPPGDLYKLDVYQVWQAALGAGALEQLIAHAVDRSKHLLSETSQ